MKAFFSKVIILCVIVGIGFLANNLLIGLFGDLFCEVTPGEYQVVKITNGRQLPIGRLGEEYGQVEPGDILKTTARYPNTDVEVVICRRDIFWQKWIRVRWAGSPTGAAWVPASSLELNQ